MKNIGDAPLVVERVDLATLTSLTGGNANANPGRLIRQDEAPGDFSVLSNTCVGTAVRPGRHCAVSVGLQADPHEHAVGHPPDPHVERR